MTQSSSSAEQSFIDHLVELRTCLIRSLWFIFIAFAGCFYFSEQLLDIVRGPIVPYLPEGGLYFIAPLEKFMAHIKVSFISAVVVSCPFWIYQAWLFIAPGLYKREKKYGLMFVLFGSVLFLSGISFVYFVVFPLGFEYLLNFGGGTDLPMITMSEYLSFFMLVSMVFGAAFQMPLVLILLGKVGIIDHHFLIKQRRVAILIMACISGVITPADPFSMIALLIPLLLLYEFSIVVVRSMNAPATKDL